MKKAAEARRRYAWRRVKVALDHQMTVGDSAAMQRAERWANAWAVLAGWNLL
ncbi:hypothetical protein [Acidithiobacillus ferrivorans]|uniref:hypothetical protein n=1 Tax=Acidithiobacillus ferrivorans TaxID=160808 RepID=UPI0016818505|nr:hypothetical protein [Acidithiobacillus ferrivorans]